MILDCSLIRCSFFPVRRPESVAYEWPSKPGLIRYYYHEDRRPDTRADVLSFGFISPLVNAVLLRIDSEASNDYLEVEMVSHMLSCKGSYRTREYMSISLQVSGNIFVGYNLGTEDIALGEMNVKLNDGKYHVVRFTRSGANATLQVDDNQIQTKHPGGTK